MKRALKFALTFSFTFVVLTACKNVSASESAAQKVSLPRGIFVSSGPKVSDKVMAMDQVAGNLIRVGWDEVEPQPGKYDFSAIDLLIRQAKKNNKKVALSVLNGPRAPSWLYEQGAEPFHYEFKTRYSQQGNRQETIPVPWDPIYLKKWEGVIRALGDKYSKDSTIAVVHITHSSKNGFEMQLPEERVNGRVETTTNGPWAKAGYKTEHHIEALKAIVDAYIAAFPNTPLDIEIHPVLDSLAPAKAIYEYGVNRAGVRFGLFSAWWSGISQRWNESMYPLLEDACRTSFCTLQLIGNQTRQPERLAQGSVSGAIEAGMAIGAKYFEVWDVDIRNRQLNNTLRTVAVSLDK